MKKMKLMFTSRGLPILGAVIAGATLAGGIAFADTGPVISSISSTPTTNGATITWMTDQGANAQVLYGTAPASTTPYTASTTVTSGFASTSQSVALTGLNPHTTYFYSVVSGNASGTFTTSSEQSFMTLPLSTGSLSANPTSGTPGSMFTLTGNGFGNAESVNVDFNGATTSATTDASGTFSMTLAAPSAAVSTSTAESITATGGTSGATATTTFTVVPATSTATSSISLNPTSGMPGSMFTVTGMDFTPFEGITLMFENATSSATADASGTFSATLTVPDNAASGTAEVSATGGMSNSTADQWFTVQPASSTSTSSSTPDLTTLQNEVIQLQNLINQLIAEVQTLLNGNGNNGNGNGNNNGNGGSYPSSTLQATIDQVVGPIRAGTTVDFTGRNWGTNEQVKVTNNGNAVTTAQADGGGNFSTGSLPVSGTPGSETYTFTGLSSGLTRSVTITVTP